MTDPVSPHASTLSLDVPDISCEHCKTSIEGAVAELDGVARVEVAIDARRVDVAFDSAAVSRNDIVGAIEAQGYVVAG
jgi:copper chaperone